MYVWEGRVERVGICMCGRGSGRVGMYVCEGRMGRVGMCTCVRGVFILTTVVNVTAVSTECDVVVLTALTATILYCTYTVRTCTVHTVYVHVHPYMLCVLHPQ